MTPGGRGTGVGCLAVLAVVLLGVVLTGHWLYRSVRPDHGRDLADAAAEAAAGEMGDVAWTMEPNVMAWEATSADWQGPDRRVEVLGMRGRLDTRSGSRASLDVRVSVTFQAYQDPTLFGQSWDAGSTTRCYRVTLDRRRYQDVRAIRCGDRSPLDLYDPGPRVQRQVQTGSDVSDALIEGFALYPLDAPRDIEDLDLSGLEDQGYEVDSVVRGGVAGISGFRREGGTEFCFVLLVTSDGGQTRWSPLREKGQDCSPELAFLPGT